MNTNRRHSPHARRALRQAYLLARDYQHGAVDTDHLLVGILRQPDSTGAQVLRALAVDARRAELEVRILHDLEDPLAVALTLTPALDRVLALADDEAQWFGHPQTGTEHFLLALARYRQGGIGALFSILNLNADVIRRHVRQQITPAASQLDRETAQQSVRLSELSRRVLNAAKLLADEDASPRLPHLLLALVQEQRGTSGQLLAASGLDQDRIHAALASAPPESPAQASDLLDAILARAADCADQLRAHYIGTEHILLAVAEHPQGAALLSGGGVAVSALVDTLRTNLQPTPVNS